MTDYTEYTDAKSSIKKRNKQEIDVRDWELLVGSLCFCSIHPLVLQAHQVNMVYDRLPGVDIPRHKQPHISSNMADPNTTSVAEDSVLHSIASKTPKEHKIENAQRITGFAVGAGSMLAAQAISHPFVVFGRQCQVNNNASRFHLSPFTVFQIMTRLERKQGLSSLWKGYGSTYIVCAVNFFSEAALSNLTQLPKEKPTQETSIKEVGAHLLLKSLGLIVSMPIAAASLVETVKTDRIKAGHSALDTLKDSLYRFVGWNRSSGRHGRLLPMWTIGLPTVLHGVIHYIIETCVQHWVLRSMREVGLISTGSQKEGSSSSDEPQPPNDMTQCYYPELAANFMAFAIPNLVLYPFSTVLNRLYVQGTRTIIDDLDNGYDVVPLSTNYVGMLDCFRTIWREEGILGFYRGFGALIVQCVLYFLILKITKFIYVQLSQDFNGKR